MGELEILRELIQLFEKFHLPYLLTGGFAVTYYGEPRSTNDIDFLVEVTKNSKRALLQALESLGPEYIIDRRSIASLGDQRTEFNVIHGDTGIKIDFWVLPQEEFNHQYRRRQVKKIAEKQVSLTSPEDLLLTKLSWCKGVFSERHFTDCVGIWQVQKGRLDEKFLMTQAKKLGVILLLNEVKSFPSNGG